MPFLFNFLLAFSGVKLNVRALLWNAQALTDERNSVRFTFIVH
jgi:hypothetical protein